LKHISGFRVGIYLKLNDFCVYTNLVPPEIQDDGQGLNLTVTLKQPLTLGCDAFGTPNPTITWTKDNRPVGFLL